MNFASVEIDGLNVSLKQQFVMSEIDVLNLLFVIEEHILVIHFKFHVSVIF